MAENKKWRILENQPVTSCQHNFSCTSLKGKRSAKGKTQPAAGQPEKNTFGRHHATPLYFTPMLIQA